MGSDFCTVLHGCNIVHIDYFPDVVEVFQLFRFGHEGSNLLVRLLLELLHFGNEGSNLLVRLLLEFFI